MLKLSGVPAERSAQSFPIRVKGFSVISLQSINLFAMLVFLSLLKQNCFLSVFAEVFGKNLVYGAETLGWGVGQEQLKPGKVQPFVKLPSRADEVPAFRKAKGLMKRDAFFVGNGDRREKRADTKLS